MELNFVFEDRETGEEFIVQIIGFNKTTALKAAKDIAKENFEDPHFIWLATPEEAEMLGYDTY